MDRVDQIKKLFRECLENSNLKQKDNLEQLFTLFLEELKLFNITRKEFETFKLNVDKAHNTYLNVKQHFDQKGNEYANLQMKIMIEEGKFVTFALMCKPRLTGLACFLFGRKYIDTLTKDVKEMYDKEEFEFQKLKKEIGNL